MARACINRIATATPPHDVHDAYRRLVLEGLPGERERRLFARMAERAGIEHRYSVFQPAVNAGRVVGDMARVFVRGEPTSTARRMRAFEAHAPDLALKAIEGLGLEGDLSRVTHLVVACCTGFVAPGLDQIVARTLGLRADVERTMVGFMGCYAAVTALRLAHHIVRSEPAARVLVLNLELCTLHFQESDDLEKILAMMLFADGCSAALVTAEEEGIALQDFRSAAIEGSSEAITWRIGEHGFDMRLSGEVPGAISRALEREAARGDADGLLRGRRPEDYAHYAVHAGGRTILDAVEAGFALGEEALRVSRDVLREFGNMSSATLMFVLERLLRREGANGPGDGFAVAFGPGLAAESFRFQRL